MSGNLGMAAHLAMLVMAGAAEMDMSQEQGVSMLQHARATKSCVSKHEDDLDAVGAAYKRLDQLVDRHRDLSEGVHDLTHRGPELQEARQLHTALGTSIKKLRQDSESLLELASRREGACELRAALRGLEGPAGDLSKGLDRLSLLQQRASEKDALKSIARSPDRDFAAVGRMYDHVSQLMDRHHFLSEQRQARDGSKEERQLHAALGKSIRSIRQRTEALLQLQARGENRGKLRSGLKQLRRPVAKLNAGLDKLSMLQQAADAKALGSLASHPNNDVASIGAMYQHVNGLVDRHQALLRQTEDGRLTGERLKETRQLHESVGGAIRSIRKDTEFLLQLAATAGSDDSRHLHSKLRDLKRPVKALQDGLGKLELLHAA